MATMSLTNRYHLRRVADSAAKACYVCYRPSSSVLITPDNKDFFYICPVHLTDKAFCSPVIDEQAEAEKRRKEALEKEIEKVKREYEEKMKRKKEKKKAESADKKGKGKDKEDEEETKKDEKEKDDKIKSIQEAAADGAKKDADLPRIYTLHKTFYQMRIDRLRNLEIAKRNRERLKDTSLFPSVPKDGI